MTHIQYDLDPNITLTPAWPWPTLNTGAGLFDMGHGNLEQIDNHLWVYEGAVPLLAVDVGVNIGTANGW